MSCSADPRWTVDGAPREALLRALREVPPAR